MHLLATTTHFYYTFNFCLQLALSDLQTKSETEIRKAQKLISEKDEELHAAEESLSGLEEVLHMPLAWTIFMYLCNT